jgi:hypothetical protein
MDRTVPGVVDAGVQVCTCSPGVDLGLTWQSRWRIGRRRRDRWSSSGQGFLGAVLCRKRTLQASCMEAYRSLGSARLKARVR